MRRQTQFNFEADIEKLLPEIKLEPSEFEQESNIKDLLTEDMHTKETYMISNQQETRISKRQKYVTQLETKECLLYAFGSEEKGESKIAIQIIQKRTGKILEVPFKKLKFEVSYLKFAYDQFGQINLLVGTKCGRLLLYKNLEEKELTVNIVHISANQITFILIPSFPNYAFMLNKIGTIYLFNFSQGRIAYQFRCSLPLIEDPTPRLIIDLSESLLGHVFSYGRIIVWEITQEMKKICCKSNMSPISHNSQKTETNSSQQPRGATQSKHFKLILRYKMSIANSFVTGIRWVDFLGIFIAFINLKGQFRIIAVNINQFYQLQQFFTVISQYSICKDRNIGKNCQKESIADAVRLKESNGIIVGKNIELCSNNGKVLKNSCLIEKYTLNNEFKICKLLTLNLSKISFLKELLLSDQREYILIRNQNEYSVVINKSKRLNG